MVQVPISAALFAVRKVLRTLRKVMRVSAQPLRNGVRFISGLSLGLVMCAARTSWGETEVQTVWSEPRFIQFDAGTQRFRLGPSQNRLTEWRRLPKPPGIFHGIRLLTHHDGNFMVLDEALPRLCLYDTAGQWLSCLALPEGLRNRTVQRLDIVMRQDGRMVYTDADGGFAYLYRERRPGEAETQWQLLAKAPIAADLRGCLEKPWFTNLCCLRAKSPTCFDGFLNLLAPAKVASMTRDTVGVPFSAWPDSLGLGWWFRVETGLDSAPGTTCFHSEQGFRTCP